MKKIILFFFGFSLFTGLSAQVQFGLKAGANFATFSGSGAEGSTSITGFYGGALINFPIARSVNIQPELIYSMEGAKEAGGTSKLSMGYIQIPVLVQYQDKSGFLVETGPQLGFLLSATAKDQTESVDVKDLFKSTAFSWVFGVGFRSKVGLGFNLRYNLGLKNNYKGDGTPSPETLKNNVVSIGLFLMLPHAAKR